MVPAHKQHPSEPLRSVAESSMPDAGSAHEVQGTVEKRTVEAVVLSAFAIKPVWMDTGKKFLEGRGSEVVQRGGRVHRLDVSAGEPFLAIAEFRFEL